MTQGTAPTSLAAEATAQAAWRLRSHVASLTAFDNILEREFESASTRQRTSSARLEQMLRYARACVPYYRDLPTTFSANLDAITDLSELVRWPILSKQQLRDNASALRSDNLPSGHRAEYSTQSSGTTGKPVEIWHTAEDKLWYTLIKQREMRWFRFDPLGAMAWIRLPQQLATEAGTPLDLNETRRGATWPLVGQFFHTGPALGFSVLNTLDAQVDWLDKERPDYLGGYAETLEHLAFAYQGRPTPALSALHSVGEQVTPTLKRRVEHTFNAPLYQGYGLNEFGPVATRCPLGDRYHVHAEYCILEVVNDDGQPCRDGERGRIVLTSLSNTAMPLIRYDTDDLATAVEGPCPCGRTLPAFADIVGRYSRIAYLPEGTLGCAAVLRDAIATLPAALSQPLRRFQIHQFRDGHFELRFETTGELEAVTQHVNAAWSAGAIQQSLDVIAVGAIARSRGGKFQDFTSDFHPDDAPANLT